MARTHGRNGRLYTAIASGGTAEPIAYLTNWSIDLSTDKVEVTAFGDANRVYVAGLPDAQGSFSGFYDTATEQLYTAAVDGVARKFYLYPNTEDGDYFSGEAIFDFSISTPVDGAVSVSGSFAATTDVTKTSA